MPDFFIKLLCGLLGFGTGIFTVLSLIEKPVWRLMRDARSVDVADSEARAVHAILKRVIHLLPPTMITAMGASSILMSAMLIQSGFDLQSVMLAAVFFVQLALIVARLFRDIAGVENVDSQGDIDAVRDGLGALALLHHRGLLMTASTLLFVYLLIAI